MINKVTLEGFKCFGKRTLFPLSQVSILTGLNGRGKSTLIQAILSTTQSLTQSGLSSIEWNGALVSLGEFDDVLTRGFDSGEIGFGFETDDNVDKQLPANIISIHRTQNQTELAEIYTAADVFTNPTREENYPTVNMESLACGTPVITFKTGGSPEILDETCGSVVPCDDIDAMEMEIRRICEEKPYSKEACLNRAKSFDMNERFEEYVELYKELI